MTDWRRDRVRAALEGRNPTVLAELAAAFAVIGDVQFLPGYALALTTDPAADRLSDLSRHERVRFLADVDLVATAVENVCASLQEGYRRVNVEIQGNADPMLHAHVWPRYDWEPADHVGRPVGFYSAQQWHDPSTALGAQHDDLRAALASEVVRLRDSVEFRFNV